MGEHNGYGHGKLVKERNILRLNGEKEDKLTSHFVLVFVSEAVLAEFFINSGRMFECTKGLPKDAKLIRFAQIQGRPDQYVATFEHPSFDPVPFGERIPVFSVEYTAYARQQEAPVLCEKCGQLVDTGKVHVSTGTGYAHEECWNEMAVDEKPAAAQH